MKQNFALFVFSFFLGVQAFPQGKQSACGVQFSSSANNSCFGQCFGSATVVASGTSPYTFSWSNGQTAATASGLCAGSYSITMTDATGCTATAAITITQPPKLVLDSVSILKATCSTCNDGKAYAYGSGGTPNYIFSWSSGYYGLPKDTTLLPGNYSVCVIDQNNCIACSNFTVGYKLTGINSSFDEMSFIYIYPNPASNYTTIELNQAIYRNSTITLYDITGRQVVCIPVQNKKQEMDISFLIPGVYFLQVENEAGVINKKLIKQ